ncbi:hypothetical protein VTI74DRAFT_7054 [Chaetomium olivicolor]
MMGVPFSQPTKPSQTNPNGAPGRVKKGSRLIKTQRKVQIGIQWVYKTKLSPGIERKLRPQSQSMSCPRLRDYRIKQGLRRQAGLERVHAPQVLLLVSVLWSNAATVVCRASSLLVTSHHPQPRHSLLHPRSHASRPQGTRSRPPSHPSRHSQTTRAKTNPRSSARPRTTTRQPPGIPLTERLPSDLKIPIPQCHAARSTLKTTHVMLCRPLVLEVLPLDALSTAAAKTSVQFVIVQFTVRLVVEHVEGGGGEG